MDDRSMSGAPAEHAGPQPSRRHADSTGSVGLADARALTILTTEHWSLLSSRSLVYNEAFARAGMFLAFLSATIVAIGLIATATGFTRGFLIVSAAVLALDLFVGLATLARISAASHEDVLYLQGMNRLRHAYHEIVPGLEPYFITAKHDDLGSVIGFYGPPPTGPLVGILHGMTTAPGMVGVICAAVAGTLAGLTWLLISGAPDPAVLAGLLVFAAAFAFLTLYTRRRILGWTTALAPRFPAPGSAGRPPRL